MVRQFRADETKTILKKVYTYSIRILSLVATDLTVTEIINTLGIEALQSTDNMENNVNEEYAVTGKEA